MKRKVIIALGLAGLAAASAHAVAPLVKLEGISAGGVLDGVNLEISRGELVAILGPSGSGKSTLLRVIGLLELPTAGTYLLNGQPVPLSPAERDLLRRRSIGVFEGTSGLDGGLTVFETVRQALAASGTSPGEQAHKVEEALRLVRLGHHARTSVGQLSGGERQRVGVARAIVAGPDLLIADEPTSGLDPRSGVELMAVLAEVAGSSTVVIATHDSRIAQRARRVVRMMNGRVGLR